MKEIKIKGWPLQFSSSAGSSGPVLRLSTYNKYWDDDDYLIAVMSFSSRKERDAAYKIGEIYQHSFSSRTSLQAAVTNIIANSKNSQNTTYIDK
jgi:hypothetical protein